jgi:hypothetical protein
MTDDVKERVAANVVTSDNLAEFTARRMGLAEVKAESVADEPVKAESEPEAAEEPSGVEGKGNEAAEEGEQKERKPNQKIERRFSEITKQREAAREEARKEREAREALESRLKELESKVAPKAAKAEPDDLGPEPKPEAFNDMFEYAKALAEYTADKKLMERDKAESDRKAQEARAEFEKTWAKRVDSVRKEMPDFDEMIQSSEVSVSDPVRDAIMESDVGPKILYHLAENPEFAAELGKKSVISALREIGRLEARFEKQAEKPVSEPESKPAAVKSTRAPAPITPIRGAISTAENNVDSDGNFHGTFAQWKAARMAKKIR